jgi:hypothetical protein
MEFFKAYRVKGQKISSHTRGNSLTPLVRR